MKPPGLLLLLLIAPALLHAEDRRPEARVQKKFMSCGLDFHGSKRRFHPC